MSLGGEIGDLLELKATLEYHREVVAPPQVQNVAGEHHALRDTLDQGRLSEHALDELRQPAERAHHLTPLEDREGAQPAHPEREQREGSDLAREGLRRGHPDLGAGVEIDPAIHLAPDRGPHHVHPPHPPPPPPPRPPLPRDPVPPPAR